MDYDTMLDFNPNPLSKFDPLNPLDRSILLAVEAAQQMTASYDRLLQAVRREKTKESAVCGHCGRAYTHGLHQITRPGMSICLSIADIGTKEQKLLLL